MKDTNPWQVVPIEPLTGPMDMASAPESVAFGGWRYRQNFQCIEDKKLSRAPGFEKFLKHNPGSGENDDLHDQLCRDFTDGSVVVSQNLQTFYDELAPTPNPASADVTSYPPFNSGFGAFCQTTLHKRETAEETVSQAITYLTCAVSTSGQRQLVIGTQTRLYALNEARGNAKLIADGLGGVPKLNCSGPRLTGAQQGDAMVLSNNYDEPFVWFFDQPTFGCAMRAIQPIPDLAVIGLTRARIVYSWKGFIVFGDTEEDNQRFEDRIRWSDEGNPLGWDPADESSLTGRFDCGYGEKLMGLTELGNYLVILTQASIWIATILPPGSAGYPINFQNVYQGGATDRSGCIAFRNTLVKVENTLYYMGRDGVYRWSIGMPAPERVQWIHLASKVIYDNLSLAACDATVGGFNPVTKDLWFSWVPVNGSCPTQCLVLNMRYEVADVRPFGVTCFANYTSDTRGTIEEFLLDFCGCQSEQELEESLNAIGLTASLKEGTACQETLPVCPSDTDEMPIWSSTPYLIPGTDFYTEDFTQEPDDPSMCTMLGDLTFDDLCAQCDTNEIFLFATAFDNCLKQWNGAYGMERYIGSGATRHPLADSVTVCGDVIASYRYEGYESRLISGAMSFGNPESEKSVRKVTVQYEADPQAQPNLLYCRIGSSAQPVDPLDPMCLIRWRDMEPVPLKCLAGLTEADLEKGLRPFIQLDYNLLQTGKYFYIDLRISGCGGASSFSRISFEIKVNPQP